MCNGTGVLDEIQIDVDFFELIPCGGCAACDEELAADLAAAELEYSFEDFREALPLWAGMQVYDVPPIPMGVNTNAVLRAHAGARAAK